MREYMSNKIFASKIFFSRINSFPCNNYVYALIMNNNKIKLIAIYKTSMFIRVKNELVF